MQLKGVAVGALGASRGFSARISPLEGRGRLAAGQETCGQGCLKPDSAELVLLSEQGLKHPSRCF